MRVTGGLAGLSGGGGRHSLFCGVKKKCHNGVCLFSVAMKAEAMHCLPTINLNKILDSV